MDVVDVAIDDLRPDSANPRRISPEQAEALTRSLEKFGFVQTGPGPPRGQYGHWRAPVPRCRAASRL